MDPHGQGEFRIADSGAQIRAAARLRQERGSAFNGLDLRWQYEDAWEYLRWQGWSWASSPWSEPDSPG